MMDIMESNNARDSKKLERLWKKYADELSEAGLPEHMQASLIDYITQGLFTGSFLRAVLANDLHGAISRADWKNRHLLPEYVNFLYNIAPMDCWGSEEAVETWIEGGGLLGREAVAASESKIAELVRSINNSGTITPQLMADAIREVVENDRG